MSIIMRVVRFFKAPHIEPGFFKFHHTCGVWSIHIHISFRIGIIRHIRIIVNVFALSKVIVGEHATGIGFIGIRIIVNVIIIVGIFVVVVIFDLFHVRFVDASFTHVLGIVEFAGCCIFGLCDCRESNYHGVV